MTHNSRGDIIGIYNGDGILRAQYKYDAWGNVLSVTDGNGNAITSATHVGNLNPFRYRGYYYDTESGFYYLMSRYYDPVTHRFINADGYFQAGNGILDANTFAYCGNNPVNNSDPTGEHSCGDPTCPKCNASRRAFLQTDKGIKLYNDCHYTNYAGVNNKGDFINATSANYSSTTTGAGHAVTTMNTGISTAAGIVGGAATTTFSAALKSSAMLSAPFSIASVSVDIALFATNPFLTGGQKIGLSAIDAGLAGVGIGISALVAFLTPAGWGVLATAAVSIAASAIWTGASFAFTSYLNNDWSTKNENEWCHRQ